ncbi:hypothetical protein RJ640_024792 [Escallonia rubra]|uniref:DUF1995 domain-containing protein n=1 Tax=Escallonia rubra TaxID=112253 RepID=A0AA88U986_9ASTE|nr:hypothetical protein RJ640_024792 [Escallonia rubra]
MATSYSSLCCYSAPNFSKTPSTAHSLTSLHPSTCGGYNGISLRRALLNSSRTNAKFDKFEGEAPKTSLEDASDPQNQSLQFQIEEDGEEDDRQHNELRFFFSTGASCGNGVYLGNFSSRSCLPSDLEGAVRQSSQATAAFVSSGGMRAIVELLIPQLQFLDDEGAQAELWGLSRTFLDTLIEETGCERVKAIFPDAGAAALLTYQWKDAAFGFASLSDRKPVEKEDEIVVMVVPDYQMLEYVERIASDLSDEPPRPLIMWNPRLVSEDVGVGFNVRKLRRYFLSFYVDMTLEFTSFDKLSHSFLTFTVVYSMRPLPSGAVFRCYPGTWKVFYDDKERPNRYLLAKDLISRPDAEDLEIIFGEVDEKSEQGPSFFSQAASIFSSFNRFLKVISK